METTWTESAEAILAEQSWQRSERERHQRLLHQLKLELQQARRQQQTTVGAPTVVIPAVITTPAPTAVLSPTPAESTALAVEPTRQERVFHHPKKIGLSVQIC